MANYILARKGWSWLSGRALAKFLKDNGSLFYVTERLNKEITVNWGNSACTNAVLNQHISTGKYWQLRNLRNSGISALVAHRRNPPRGEVLVARNNNHQAGNDIVLVTPNDSLPVANFYTEFRNFSREIRIHAFLQEEGLQTRAFRKYTEEKEEEFPIRNLSHGYRFKLVGLSDPLKELTKKVLSALKMDFGCLDVGINGKEQKYTIIEANSAPSLINNEASLKWYANNIGRRIFPEWKIIE